MLQSCQNRISKRNFKNPENYSEYLKNYSVEDALKAGVDPEYAETASEDALEQLNEFQLLDYNQQMNFLIL
ncbi:hypothetical protein [Carnobacterium alterfunditum]|uniref:hypothetical protein n=1 Tax=Carnobacterium alterfunditum TaxID=28230 RepID=UPI00054CEAFE|nr:hypothetical protein [Carnobacterium alterfunditum]